jgi:tRNA(Ile2) C34 agmatinyltransferase TiaS
MMDKYAVATPDDQGDGHKKLSAQGCPKCGGTVQRYGSVLRCEACGTEPFEHESNKPKR